MASDDNSRDDSVEIANQIIGLANALLKEGVDPAEIAAGLRHGAANFSAFESTQAGAGVEEVRLMVEEFTRMLEYYFERHAPAATPATGLHRLVEQVKNES